MSRSLVPVYIKPHLIPFLFQYFKSDEKAEINGKKVKAVKISNRSRLGKVIRLLVSKTDTKQRCDTNHSFFFSIVNQTSTTKYFGAAYKYEDGRSSFLEMTQEGADLVNQELQEMLDQALMFFLNGFQHKDGDAGLEKGIHIFCEKYDLFEFGYDVAAIRRKYYRWLKTLDIPA